MASIEFGPGFLIMDPLDNIEVKPMKCKKCKKFDTVPGMKWGVCDRRRRSSSRVTSMITGPETRCPYKYGEYEKKEESDGL